MPSHPIQASPYSTEKLLFHEPALAAIEAGVDAPLIQVHLMPSLACAHACRWCVVEGTLVDLIGGARVPVERVAVGDLVDLAGDSFMHPGLGAAVTGVFSRVVNKVVLVTAGDHRIWVTEEHPFLTADGFVEAGDLDTSHRVAIRVESKGNVEQWGMKLACKWVPVTSVNPQIGPVRVHNLSVQGFEAFIANGFLTHNCSYGHRRPEDPPEAHGWKNMALMSDAMMPGAKYLALPAELKSMGVQAVELTGGGEPFQHPQTVAFLDLLAPTGIALGVVSHGALIRPLEADAIAQCNWKWARISIDAGKPGTYCATRRVGEGQWIKAWRAVRLLADRRREGVRVGVGFVVDQGNWREVGECIAHARDAGADNVRVSLAFTPEGLDRFPERAAMFDSIAAQVAEQRAVGGIDVFDLVTERKGNLGGRFQDYDRCSWKDIGCVIGGDLNIFACCSWAFNPAGLVTDFKDRTFPEAWRSPEAQAWRRRHNAREACPIECLYERRNLRALELVAMGAAAREVLRRSGEAPQHVEFI